MKNILLLLIFILLTSFSFCQSPIIVVDGFFLKITKSETLKYLGSENIADTSFMEPDSAQILLGDYGLNGFFIIRTSDPRGEKSSSLRADNLLFNEAPTLYINDSLMVNFDLNSINPQEIESIEIISPLTSVRQRGPEWKSGILKIYMKEKLPPINRTSCGLQDPA